MNAQLEYRPGSLVEARGREWVVMPESGDSVLVLRPLGGGEYTTCIHLDLETVEPASFPLPDPALAGGRAAGLLLRDAFTLKLRAGAGPFRSFGNIAVEPRPYQLVPLLMALRQQTVRLLIADDVGIGKTIEGALIARELLDRGEITRLTVLCPPHLCEQWQEELAQRFNIRAEIVRTSTAGRLERGLPAGKSLFEVHPFTVVSLDYIKSDRRRDEFQRACPEFVIVDEAHTCTLGQARSRHLRYKLLRGLADAPERHMVFLTATPHSGDDAAFYNLLGLLHDDFHRLGEAAGEEREALRRRLGEHFVQRRRPDIEEWQDNKLFPDRKVRETTYRLTGDWGRIFNDVLEYAREMIESGESLGKRQQRMNWWAALALLRCVSSSPAAAMQALRTRILAEEKGTEFTEEDEQAMAAAVYDTTDDDLESDDTTPGVLTSDNAVYLGVLMEQARDLHGPKADPKLKALIRQLKELVAEGFHLVVFCRYIATAHYVAEHVGKALKDHAVIAVTGELTPAEREERVYGLADSPRRILVATDCLSEGINLQELFDAVIHYDLSWNPTRHEQREGRVDRFGQKSPEVRAVMLYGEDNPVDGAVLRVILRKAERIRKELGVFVPMPEDADRVTEAVLQAVMMGRGSLDARQAQLSLVLDDLDERLEGEWESLREKAAKNRTIFAQRRLRPEEVMPEWERAMEALGREDDVARFVAEAAERLLSPAHIQRQSPMPLPLEHLPDALRERLAAHGLERNVSLAFHYPSPEGSLYVHRTHPLVAELADYITEIALDGDDPEIATRATALFTGQVETRTVLWLLRLRVQITYTRGERARTLLAEEAITVAQAGSEPLQILAPDASRRLLAAVAERDMNDALRQRHVSRALDEWPGRQADIEALARERAEAILADHRRVRDAAHAKGTYQVEPVLPMDVVGVYVLVPARSL